ncbi:MAG TPA: hypothetical protein VH620_01025 [Gaiella sp.]
MIVRIVLWRLDERSPPVETLREALDELEPLPPPGMLLVNEAAERIGALLVSEDDEPPPAQLEELRALVGRDPDLYEEFDAL